MQLPEQFNAYIAQICDQLRWKKARPVIQREMEAHLCDQYDAFVKSGMPEDIAVEEALRRTGDAVEIGTGLDRVHRPKPSWGLLILTGILLLTGLAVKLFFTYDSDYPYELPKMLIASVLGIGCLFGAYFIDFTLIGKRPLLIYAGAVLFVLFGMLPGMPHFYGRSYYAIQFLLVLPAAFAALLYKLRGKGYRGMLLAFGGLAAESICCMLIPAMTGLLPVAVSGIALLIVAVRRDWFQVGQKQGSVLLTICTAISTALAVLRLVNSAYYMQRLTTAFHPEVDPYNTGFVGMIVQALLSGAKLFGPGTTGEYLSAPPFIEQPEFLLTLLIHRVGWISFFVIIAVYALFFTLAVRKCIKQKNMLGRMVSLSVILTLAIQTVIYVAYNLGLNLIEGIALPLVSYGNTALVIDMALIGIMLSTFRTGSLVRDETSVAHRSKVWQHIKDRVHWNDGELTISFKKKLAS